MASFAAFGASFSPFGQRRIVPDTTEGEDEDETDNNDLLLLSFANEHLLQDEHYDTNLPQHNSLAPPLGQQAAIALPRNVSNATALLPCEHNPEEKKRALFQVYEGKYGIELNLKKGEWHVYFFFLRWR